MAYQIDATVTTLKQTMWSLQNMLRDLSLAGWTYLDGMVGGAVTTPSLSAAAWDAVTNPDTALLDGDYVVLRVPAGSGDEGVVSLWLVDGGSKYLMLKAHPAGWDEVTHASNDATRDLGGTTCIVCGVSNVTELRVIVNQNRAIILGMAAALSPYYFGYLGFIQSHYGAVGTAPDPNPLLVTGGQFTPGSAGAPMSMLSVIDTPTQYVTSGVAGYESTAGTSMLLNMQPNHRESPPIPSHTLLPCVIGTTLASYQEIRGELEGVFFYGPPASLTQDTVISQNGAQYLVMSDIVIGPVV